MIRLGSVIKPAHVSNASQHRHVHVIQRSYSCGVGGDRKVRQVEQSWKYKRLGKGQLEPHFDSCHTKQP